MGRGGDRLAPTNASLMERSTKVFTSKEKISVDHSVFPDPPRVPGRRCHRGPCDSAVAKRLESNRARLEAALLRARGIPAGNPGRDHRAGPKRAANVKPTPEKLAWMNLELISFPHFGMSTFSGVRQGDGKQNPAIFTARQVRRVAVGERPQGRRHQNDRLRRQAPRGFRPLAYQGERL